MSGTTAARVALSASLLLLAASTVAPPLEAQETDPADGASAEEQARSVAEAWLELVWNDQPEESWEAASEAFKAQVTSQQWAQAAGSVSGQTGAFEDRTLLTADADPGLPNLPAGDYVLLTYASTFANAEAREVVTMVREDGQWKAIGYYVVPP